MNQAMLESDQSSVESLECLVPSGGSTDATQFVRSFLSPEELQQLSDRILCNPLLSPSAYEDRFTNPTIDCRDVCQACLVTLPAYVTVRLASRPSQKPSGIAQSGFEAAFLSVGDTGPTPSFRK